MLEATGDNYTSLPSMAMHMGGEIVIKGRRVIRYQSLSSMAMTAVGAIFVE